MTMTAAERVEFLESRRKGIGGSDVAAILGVSKWKTPYQVYLEKTNEMPEMPETNMGPKTWGNLLELPIGQYFADATQKNIRRAEGTFSHPQYPFLLANLDFIVEVEDVPLEIKNVTLYKEGEWQDAVPVEYMLQCQHYIYVRGVTHCYIAVLIGGQNFKWFRIDRHQDLIDEMEKKLVSFWQDNVLTGVAPDAHFGDSEIFDAFFRKKGSGDVFLTDAQELMARRYAHLGDLIKDLERERGELQALLKQAFLDQVPQDGNNPRAKITAEGQEFVITWSRYPMTRVDADLLKENYLETYEMCKKTTESGSFRVQIRKEKSK